MPRTHTYDAILLGAGHHSLILQAYLGRAGLKTICLERLPEPGGGLTTIDFPQGSGFLHNTHSFYHRRLTRLPWYRDLQLERYGLRYIEPDLNVALICGDGRVLQWWTDFDKTVESFARFNEQDAKTLHRWRDDFRVLVRDVLEPEAAAPPLEPKQREELLSRTAAGRLLLDVSRLSPLEFVQREFSDPTVQAGLLFFNGLREVDLRAAGFGHHIPALLAGEGKAQMCVGGSKKLADALLAVVRESGGEVRAGFLPEKILIEQGHVTGVEGGFDEVYKAPLVISGLNPQQTFLELIDEQHLPAEWAQKADQFKYNLLAPLFSVHVNLHQPPRYRAAEKHPEVENALMVILGLEHVDQFPEMVGHHQQRTLAPPVVWGSCPTQFDPSQAPDGKHTAFLWEKAPYKVHGDPHIWDEIKLEHGEQLLKFWRRFAPAIQSSIIDGFARSPQDTRRTLWNMQEGDLLVGALDGQNGYHRPFAGAGHYRTCIEGLYLCGSCCHPGGNITGLAGYNCAQVLLADLQLPAPWAPEPIEQRLEKLRDS